MNNYTFDINELLMRIFKYFFEGLIVAIAAFLIPGKKMAAGEIITIGIIAAATFSVLDLFAPSIGSAARLGTGFSVGSQLVGGMAPMPLAK